MTNEERRLAEEIISTEINANSFMRLNQLTVFLERNGLNRAIYNNQGPKRWLLSEFPEFQISGDNGKEVITFSSKSSKHVKESLVIKKNDAIALDSLLQQRDDIKSISYCVGVISFLNSQVAFIIPEYRKNKNADHNQSVLFFPALSSTIPEQIVFNTKENIYLVLYAKKGTAENPKTGIEHTTIDYSVPIKVIRTIPRKNCSYIEISNNEIILGISEVVDRRAFISENHDIIFQLIKEAILNSAGAIKPAEIPAILDSLNSYGIDRYIYQGEQLQLWIKSYFPELYVHPSSDGGGHEYIYLREVSDEDFAKGGLKDEDNDRIRRAIIKYLVNNTSIPIREISRKVFMPNGIDPRFYPLGKTWDRWILDQPEFVISDNGEEISLSDATLIPVPAPAPILTKSELSEEECLELDRLYKENQLIEYLSCECFRRLKPNEIPLGYLQQAMTVARRLVFSSEEGEIKLNRFQQQLLLAKDESEFNSWKNGTLYSDDVIDQCLATMLFPETRKCVGKMLNSALYTSSRGDMYTDSGTGKTWGLISRAQLFRNELTLPLYVLGAFAQTSPAGIRQLIYSLCKFIQEINESSIVSLQREGAVQALNFPHVLRAIMSAPCSCNLDLDTSIQTNILSVFVDTFCMDELDDTLSSALFPDENGMHRRMIDLVKRYESWEETHVVNFLSMRPSPSLQLLEKCIALKWGELSILDSGKNGHDEATRPELPAAFLRLLSWFLTHSGRNTLEAIIEYPSKGRGEKLTTRKKCIMLLRALPVIRRQAETIPACYNLGSYLANYMYPDFEKYSTSEVFSSEIAILVSDWHDYAQTRFQMRKPSAESMNSERKAVYAELFREYGQDQERERILQSSFADECMSIHDVKSLAQDDIESLLDEYYSMCAYEAYTRLYRSALENEAITLGEEYKNNYVESLIQLRRFNDLVNQLLNDQSLSEQDRKKYLVRTICGNFYTYRYTAGAFDIFTEAFSIHDAEALLLEQLRTNNFPVITSLIAIYISTKKYFEARYLFDIYHVRAEVGNTRIYSQFKGAFDHETNHVLQINGDSNHYNVIQTATYALTPHKLLEFLAWASNIRIPNQVNYSPKHAHAFSFNQLLKDPNNTTYWQNFLKHLSSRLTQYPINAWLVCVCDGMLSAVWNLSHSFDVRRAYEMVLDQVRDLNWPNRYFPVALMPYITDFIVRKDDVELCKSLLGVVKDETIWGRLSRNNVWATDYKRSSSAFSSYCIRKLKETGNKLYSDLLRITSPSVSAKELLTIASMPSNTDYLIRQCCQKYLDGRQISETQTLIKELDRSNLSFREIEALDLLRIAYTDEAELLDAHPEFQDEEDVYVFKQDCIHILLHYPNADGLLSFDRDHNNTQYKRLVYSYVFGAFYNNEIYDSYSIDYNAFLISTDRVILMAFLRKVFYSQLIYNTSFDSFYTRWRYQKIYLTLAIDAEGPANDDEIIRVMKSHHHVEQILEKYYLPFKSAIDDYLDTTSVCIEEKMHFLYCLINGQFSEYFDKYSDNLQHHSEHVIKLMQQCVSMLDYRGFSYALYRFYGDEIRNNTFQNARKAAGIVPECYDAICAIENHFNEQNAYETFQDFLNCQKPNECVNAMLRLDDVRYEAFHDFVIPFVCSRQFPFQIYKRFRNLVLNRNGRTGATNISRYSYLFKYLSLKEPSAWKVFLYIEAIQAGNDGDRDKTKHLVEELGSDFAECLPGSWFDEANELQQYAYGERPKFTAYVNNLDASDSGTSSDAPFVFCSILLQRLGQPETALTSSELKDAWNVFLDEESISEDRVVSGCLVLLNYNKQVLSDPAKEIARKLGLYVLNDTSVGTITADDRIAVIADLISHEVTETELFSQFEELLNLCTLDSWCHYHEVIRQFIAGRYGINKSFIKAYDEILLPCSKNLVALHNQAYSLEKYLKDLKEYHSRILPMPFFQFQNVLYNAIGAQIDALEDGVQLIIRLEEPAEGLSGGFVYFFIKNIGSRSVPLEECEIGFQNVTTRFENSTLDILHPKYVIGAKKELSAVPEDGITVRILHKGIVLSEHHLDKEAFRMSSSDRGINLSVNGEPDHYDVSRARIVFGRNDELGRIKSNIKEKGKALLYGPSRIGKTSILDSVRALARNNKNVIAVTFAGEDAGKGTDYKRIAENATSDQIEETLLVSSIIAAFSKPGRLEKPENITQNIEDSIRGILSDVKQTLCDRYGNLNTFLKQNNLELWLILDEFQQIVSRWTPSETGEFYDICQDYLNSSSSIKLIICGSDDLLKSMVLSENSQWRVLFPPDMIGVQVKALPQDSFLEMIKTEPLISGRNIEEIGMSYSDEALDALYRYTGGVPLYGKQICNQVIRNLDSNGGFGIRSKVYSVDITQATQVLIDSQKKRSGDVFAIYEAVIKGLDERDVLILSYVAKYMREKGVIGCPYSAFTQNKYGSFRYIVEGEDPFKRLNDSLAIAEARAIIRKVGSSADDHIYTFCTVFFYYAFLGKADDEFQLEEKLFAGADEATERFDEAIQVENAYMALSSEERRRALALIWDADTKISGDYRANHFLPQTIIQNHAEGDLVTGDKNVQNNIQNITNAFTTLLSGDASIQSMLTAFQRLPSVRTFLLADGNNASLDAMIEQLQNAQGDETEELRIAAEIEEQTAPLEQNMMGMTFASAVNAPGFFNVTEDRWPVLVGVEKRELENQLPPEFITAIGFAVMLHNVFRMIQDNANALSEEDRSEEDIKRIREIKSASAEMDYCPVAIMYCKVVEAMLKELHTSIYVTKLADRPLKTYDGITFADLEDSDGIIDITHKDLTIGSFSYPISKPLNDEEDNDIDHPDRFAYGPKYFWIHKITNCSNRKDDVNIEWYKHAIDLSIIRGIRNKSAHEAKPITKENFDWLIETLFRNGELFRIVSLAKKKYPIS